MNINAPAWTTLAKAITTCWPEIGADAKHPIIRATTINRTTWNNEIDKFNESNPDAKYGPPIVVVDVGQMVPDNQWGADNDAYTWKLAIYYIRSQQLTPQESADESLIVELVETKLSILRDYLLHLDGLHGLFVIEQPIMDTTYDNPANQAFIDRQVSLFGGMLLVNGFIGQQWKGSNS